MAKETEIFYFNSCSKSPVFIPDPGCQESLQTERESRLCQTSCCRCGLWIFTITTWKDLRGRGLCLSSHGRSEESKRRGPKVTTDSVRVELVKSEWLRANGHIPTLSRSFSVYVYQNTVCTTTWTPQPNDDMFHDQLRVSIQRKGDFSAFPNGGISIPPTISTGFHHEISRNLV